LPFLGGDVATPWRIVVSTQNYKRMLAFLKKRPSGRDLGSFLMGFWGKLSPNLEVKIPKKGGKNKALYKN